MKFQKGAKNDICWLKPDVKQEEIKELVALSWNFSQEVFFI